MLGVSIIGLGMAAEPHARALLNLSHRAQVRWAATRSEARAHAFASRFPFPTTDDIQAAIADPAVDAVLVLTPANTHHTLAMQALDRGKHVLVEKPLDAKLGQAAAIVARARDAGLVLGVVLQHRYRTSTLRLEQLVRSGDLGEIQFAVVVVPWWRPQAYYDEPERGTLNRDGGGVLLTQAIHTLDLFRALVGPISVQAAHARTTALHQMEGEDYVSALLTLPNGAPATLLATTAAYPGSPERIEIVGTHGSAVLEGGTLITCFQSGSGERIDDDGRSGAGADFMNFPHQAHQALIEDFIESIETGRSPRASGAEGLATQRLIEQVLTCAFSSGVSEAQAPTQIHREIVG